MSGNLNADTITASTPRTITTANLAETNITNTFSTEQHFYNSSVGVYSDPLVGTPAAIKVGSGGIAVNGIGNFANSVGNTGLEIGKYSTSETPFIDFHSSGLSADYDSRIIANGGTGSNGSGGLTIWSSTLTLGVMPYIYQTNSAYIVSHGTNANGTFVKFADGIMLCWGLTSAALSFGNGSGGTIAFPATFSSGPYMLLTSDNSVNSYVNSLNISTTTFQFISSSLINTVRWMVFGFWYGSS